MPVAPYANQSCAQLSRTITDKPRHDYDEAHSLVEFLVVGSSPNMAYGGGI